MASLTPPHCILIPISTSTHALELASALDSILIVMTGTRPRLYLRGQSTPRRTGTLESEVRRRHTFPELPRRQRPRPRRRNPPPPVYSEALREKCRRGKEQRLPYDYHIRSQLSCSRCGCEGTFFLRLAYMPGRAGQHYYVVSDLLYISEAHAADSLAPVHGQRMWGHTLATATTD